MNRAGKLWMVLLVAAVGLWGCNQAASGANGQADKIKALQDKCVRLEDDFKSAATARDQAREQPHRPPGRTRPDGGAAGRATEGSRGRQGGRQGARRPAAAAGRPHRRARYAPTRGDKMKKGLQSLLGQDDALSAPAHPPITAVGGIAAEGSEREEFHRRERGAQFSAVGFFRADLASVFGLEFAYG